MYQVFANEELIYDTSLSIDESLQIINPYLVLSKNEGGSFSFTFPFNHRLWDNDWRNHKFLLGKNDYVIIFKDGKWLWEGCPTGYENDIFGDYRMSCEGALSYLKGVKIPLQVMIDTTGETLETNIEEFTAAVLDYYNARIEELNDEFNLGNNGILHKKILLGSINVSSEIEGPYHFQRIVNFESCFDALQKRIIDDFGGEYYITKPGDDLLLNYRHDPGTSFVNKAMVKLGSNILDYDISEDFELATSVIPLGDLYNENHPGDSKWWWKKTDSRFSDIEQRANLQWYFNPDGTQHGCRVYLSNTLEHKKLVQKYGFHEVILDLETVVAKFPQHDGTSTGGWEYYVEQYGVSEWRSMDDYLGESPEWIVHETSVDDVTYRQDYCKALLIYAIDYLERQQFNKLVLAVTATDIDAEENIKKDLVFAQGEFFPVSADLFGRDAKLYEATQIKIGLDSPEDVSITLGGEDNEITKMIRYK